MKPDHLICGDRIWECTVRILQVNSITGVKTKINLERKKVKNPHLLKSLHLNTEHIENLPPKTGGIFDKFNKSPYICRRSSSRDG
jgi:hypothetical protein